MRPIVVNDMAAVSSIDPSCRQAFHTRGSACASQRMCLPSSRLSATRPTLGMQLQPEGQGELQDAHGCRHGGAKRKIASGLRTARCLLPQHASMTATAKSNDPSSRLI